MDTRPKPADWMKSRHSNSAGCVEVRRRNGLMEVRNSRVPGQGIMRFTPAEWADIIQDVKAGQVDWDKVPDEG